MNADNKTINTLSNIAGYCEKIEAALERFTPTRDDFDEEFFYRDGIAFYVQQIGELVKELPDSFIGEYDQIPWHQISGFRNIIAHAYGSVDPDILWETVTEDIPKLYSFCQEIAE